MEIESKIMKTLQKELKNAEKVLNGPKTDVSSFVVMNKLLL